MQNTKIFKLLSNFSHQERQRFLDFLNSIYFNQNDDLVLCFAALLPSLQKTKPISQTDLEVWKKIYPNKKFDKARYHRVCSDLLKEAERFLAYFKFAQNKSLQNIFTLQNLNEKRAMAQLPYYLNYAKQFNEKSKIKDGEFYYHQFLIADQRYMFDVNNSNRTDNKALIELINNIDVYYLIIKLQAFCAALHYQNVSNLDVELLFMDEILIHLKKKSYKEIPVINIYYHILLTQLEKENEQHFQNLKSLLLKNIHLFPQSLAREMYAHAIQYCIKKINAGEVIYLTEVFLLYQQTLKLELIQTNGLLSPHDFKNIITVGLRTNNHKWVESFIHQYKEKLPADHQENAFTYSMARVYFFRNEFDKVLQLLQQVEYDDVFYLLDAKVTLIKTFYELKEFDSLSALLDSFKMLLRRKKVISNQQRIIYSHFVQFVKKLSQGLDKKKAAALKDELQTATDVADIGWLKEKVEELLNKKK